MAQRIEILGRHFNPNTTVKTPLKVVITGSTGNIGYSLVFMIGQGRLLGPNQPIDLCLYDIPQAEKTLQGVVMELNDCAFPLLNTIVGTSNLETAFKGAQVVLLVGALPRKQGMERQDLLGVNAKIFKEQGKALNDFADRNVKVCVVGNPANTNAMITSYYAPNISPKNFTALTRLDQNRAVSQIANKLNVPCDNVKNLIIWGNHSVTQYADTKYGYIQGQQVVGIDALVNDEKWLKDQFISTVAKRGAAIIQARGASSAASAANAVCDHIHDWIVGTKPGEFVSMGIMSDGSYGVPKGINFSFPVTCKNGEWNIVQGLPWNNFDKQKIEVTTKELLEEKDMALKSLQ